MTRDEGFPWPEDFWAELQNMFCCGHELSRAVYILSVQIVKFPEIHFKIDVLFASLVPAPHVKSTH